ncbi:hypothetical protein L2E82_30892 [Cichorium intybus]|uniref:Uncharacterized protein n=1 Tax=Cichorium intybus TaxID=13427 RepID=A0ACB9D1L5_CICIN|nr:hypothetical protein L2E82_30892 [Cichorium intybus]
MIVLSATRSKRLTSTGERESSKSYTHRYRNSLLRQPQSDPLFLMICKEQIQDFIDCIYNIQDVQLANLVIDENTKQGAVVDPVEPEKHPGTTSVTDSVTSDGITTFIQKKLGGKHHQFKRGYKNVIVEGIRLTSGHGALKENHWLDDGAYLMHLWTPESRPVVDLGDTS